MHFVQLFQVKYYDRQEKIAIGIHKKNVREVERLHEKILKRNVRANDLEQFDKQRARIRNNYVSTSSPLAETKIPKESILSKDCSNVEVEGSSLRWKGQNGMNGLQTNSFQYSQMYGQNKKSFYGFSHVKT